jgi:pyruvate kinase
MNDSTRQERLRHALAAIQTLRHAARAAEQEYGADIDQVAAGRRESAINLAHYLAVRRHDLRDLQTDLACLGLSSLGRMEAHVMASLDAVLRVLCTLLNEPPPADLSIESSDAFRNGSARLARNADAVLGPPPRTCQTRIMVTMANEAADDPKLIPNLADAGMDMMRINCAHDSSAVWARMAQRLRAAEQPHGRRCVIECDLAGPKLRTGPIEAGPAVVKWKPARDALGRVTRDARVRFVAENVQQAGEALIVPVEGEIIGKAKAGDTITLTDARERKRMLHVREVREDECLCETDRTAYVVPGMQLKLRRDGKVIAKAVIGALPPSEQVIHLSDGDTLDVVRGNAPGRNANGHDASAVISCAISQVFESVQPGQPILFDDGTIRGEIVRVDEDQFRVKIISANKGKLRAGKGINLPETELRLPALTQEDIEHLEQVASFTDAVALSFVQQTSDIDDLLREIARLDATHLGVVLKIEKRSAFDNLTALLFSAMRHPKLAVMIARGDLGVEVGFERMSEVQEEMLWLCEAAHVPVIWATQVLESLAKGGLASRPEVTDAAMAGRAECVMLNKGPHIVETLGFLRDVMARVGEHQAKKSARLRRLGVAG